MTSNVRSTKPASESESCALQRIDGVSLLNCAGRPSGPEVEREVDEAERLHDAECGIVGLLERADDVIETAFDVRCEAGPRTGSFRASCRGSRRTAKELARDRVDRRRARVRIRQVLVLVALARDSRTTCASRSPTPCSGRAVDVDDLPFVHLEQRVLTVGRGHVIERITGRPRKAQEVPHIRCACRRVVERRHRVGLVAEISYWARNVRIGRIPLRLDAAVDDVLAARILARYRRRPGPSRPGSVNG